MQLFKAAAPRKGVLTLRRKRAIYARSLRLQRLCQWFDSNSPCAPGAPGRPGSDTGLIRSGVALNGRTEAATLGPAPGVYAKHGGFTYHAGGRDRQ